MKKQILVLLIILTTITYAQSPWPPMTHWECGSPILQQQDISANPGTQTVFANFMNSFRGSFNSVNSSTNTYVIPVVFHIISDAYSVTPIPTYAQIQWQLATLNAAFSNSLNSLNNSGIGPRGTNTQIQFCLAKLVQTSSTPTAWPSSNYGVINYTTTNTALTSNAVVTNSASLQSFATLTNYTLNFPPSMYLNIWCVPNITSQSSGYSISDPPGIIGVASSPWQSMVIDGIIMRNDCIGNNTYNNFNMFAPLDKGYILAHEVGHYLGLFHTFETITSNSLSTANGVVGCYGTNGTSALNDGDLVFDTPPTLANSNVGPGPINTCAETYSPYGAAANENDQVENFMSYSDDDYMNTFTQNQTDRMWAALDGSQPPAAFLTAQRSNLWSASNLSLTGVSTSPSCGPGLLTAVFNSSIVPASITCSSAVIQFNVPVLPTYLTATSFTWAFGDGGTSNQANPTHTYNASPGTYTVTLTVSDGSTTATHSMVVNIPTANPRIVGHSGENFSVCRGTEQTIFIEFSQYVNSALLTDGTNYYTVTNNFIHACTSPSGVYRYPFTFTITNSASFSLVPSFCGTLSMGVASFTVTDCCSNLVSNGDFENGNTGFYSSYALNTYSTGAGKGAINFPVLTDYPTMGNTIGLTGKALVIDSYEYNNLSNTCHVPNHKRLLAGQGLNGLKPSTEYYVSLKINQSNDSLAYPLTCGPNKFNIRLYSSSGDILTENMVPSTVPSATCTVGGSKNAAMQVFNFNVTTPGTITTLTSFSFEVSEIDNFGFAGYGNDLVMDNFILSEKNPPIVISPSNPIACIDHTVQLTASNNCINLSNYSLVWSPQAGLSCTNCANPVVTPTAETVYTLLAIPPITTPPSPNISVSTTVNVTYTCCAPSTTAYTQHTLSVVNSTSFSAPLLFQNSFTIQPNSSVSFGLQEFLFAPNVKITVGSNAILQLDGSHLYSCGAAMWQGIVLEDGAQLLSVNPTKDNLIEDAITAIDIKSQTTNSFALNIHKTTFNKNYIDINMSNCTLTPSSFTVDNCVFTCRNMTFTSSDWPNTGTVSAGSTATANLRHAFTGSPTTGMAPPYLNQSTFTITNLKYPYLTQPSHIAISLGTVGTTTGAPGATNGTVSMPGITIGSPTASAFNLFDAHGCFIYAKNSNVNVVNSVFQNTQTYTVSVGTLTPGSAIVHSTSGTVHYMLNASSTVSTTGARFWDCHKAIDLKNTYLFWLENATLRSTQTTANGPTLTLAGNTGVYANTNRFDYYIAFNEFTNIRNGVNIAVNAGPTAVPPCSTCCCGIFAHRIRIDNNLFSAGTSTTGFVDRAVDLTAQNGVYWYVPSFSVSPPVQGFVVTNNTITNVFRGVSANGSNGFRVDISSNNIGLKEDNIFNSGQEQYGIQLQNATPTSSTTTGRNLITSNTVSFTAMANTNTIGGLILVKNNGYATFSPSVTCNILKNGHKGFVFSGVNTQAVWAVNDMDLPMKRGFCLENAGEIGTQGGNTTVIANRWLSGAWTSTAQTYVDAGCTTVNSHLYVRSGAPSTPTNNLASPFALQSYAVSGIHAISTPTADYTCSTFPNAKVLHVPDEADYLYSDQYYMAQTALYRYLNSNDSAIVAGNIPADNFYSSLSGSSIEQFMLAEQKLYSGEVGDATSILNDIDDSGFNTVETNYKTYYTRYLSYLNLETDERYPYDDSTSLRSLAELCPSTNGNCIYQAISLFNSIYGQIINPDCSGTHSRPQSESNTTGLNEAKKTNELTIFPNPATTQLIIKSNKKEQIVRIKISDLSGRQLLDESLNIRDFIAKLEIQLNNGAYLVTLFSSDNEKTFKKLIVSK